MNAPDGTDPAAAIPADDRAEQQRLLTDESVEDEEAPTGPAPGGERGLEADEADLQEQDAVVADDDERDRGDER